MSTSITRAVSRRRWVATSAAAMAGIPQVEPGKTFSMGAGFGNFNGQSAIAVGVSGRVSDRVIVKGGIAGSSGGKATSSAGVGYSW